MARLGSSAPSAGTSYGRLAGGSPVYKGTYGGLLKHLFDLLDRKALAGRPALFAATGRAEQHALMIEHGMRPLFGFFGALTLPLGVDATEKDFAGSSELTEAAKVRIAGAVDHLERLVGRS